jgi:hypothetical protein
LEFEAITEIKKKWISNGIYTLYKEIHCSHYTIRRMIVSGNWKTGRLLPAIEATFQD